MKIRLYSDLHNELYSHIKWDRRKNDNIVLYGWSIPELPDDHDTVLVLAGDIWDYQRACEYAFRMSERFKAIILVPGNHEYYGHDIKRTPLKAVLDIYDKHGISWPKNVHVLNGTSISIDGVLFFGATFWTDLNKQNPLAMYTAKQRMNDYRKIVYDGNKITPKDTVGYNRDARLLARIYGTRAEETKKVIITHHAPEKSLQRQLFDSYRYDNEVDYCYWNTGVEDIHEMYDMWLFGHVHVNCNREVLGTHYASNCRGYQTSQHNLTVPDFDPLGLRLEI